MKRQEINIFKQHPKGLYFLFFTELWERFSYYGMRAILVLFLISETSREDAGLGGVKLRPLIYIVGTQH